MYIEITSTPSLIQAADFIKGAFIQIRVKATKTTQMGKNFSVKMEDMIIAIRTQKQHAQRLVADFFERSKSTEPFIIKGTECHVID